MSSASACLALAVVFIATGSAVAGVDGLSLRACAEEDEECVENQPLQLLQTVHTLHDVAVPADDYSHFRLNASGHAAGDIAVSVFRPGAYYASTRFDWSSMIGDISVCGHTLFSNDFRSAPHSPTDLNENGVGLASEFKKVLGFTEAQSGDPFLKIGVGKLVKGSCAECKEDYNWRRPYKFAADPSWNITQPAENVVEMQQEESLSGNKWGYSLRKRVHLHLNGTLLVTTELRNTGAESFSTEWYSHNFISVDKRPSGPPWVLLMDSISDLKTLSETSLDEYFQKEAPNRLIVKKEIDGSVYGGFAKEQPWSNGDYSAVYNSSSMPLVVNSTIVGGPRPLSAYYLWANPETLSPEPNLMIKLDPGETEVWSQQLTFTCR